MNDWAAPPSADRVPTLTEVVDLAAPALDIGPELGTAAWPDAGAAEGDAPPLQDAADTAPAAMPADTFEPLPGAEPQPQPQPFGDEGSAPPVECWAGSDAPPVEAPPVAWIDTGAPQSAVADAAPAIDTHAVVALALAELQPRLDMLLESRLREALAPALARAAEGLIREARGELASALNELLQDAVRRALQRQAAAAPGADAFPPHRP